MSAKITEVIGAVIDVQFPVDEVPNIYDALKVVETGTTLEVQQQMGDGIVKTIAMGEAEGLRRGLEVENTKSAIQVPVGTETLGRIMNVLGDPIDEQGPIECKERLPIHRAAPDYTDQSGDAPMKGIIDIVMTYGRELPHLINCIKDSHVDHDKKDDADMVYSTVHKAKGMEYDQVKLLDDFLGEEKLSTFLTTLI